MNLSHYRDFAVIFLKQALLFCIEVREFLAVNIPIWTANGAFVDSIVW